MITKETLNLLSYASQDKNLSSNDFRILFLTALNPELTHNFITECKFIKTSSTISKSFSNLLKLNYITRKNTNKIRVKNVSTYHNIINTNKAILPKNNNSLIIHTDTYFKNINELFDYFHSQLPSNKYINVTSHKKCFDLMLHKDNFSSSFIINQIDLIKSDVTLKNKIVSPALLRKYLKEKQIQLKNKEKQND